MMRAVIVGALLLAGALCQGVSESAAAGERIVIKVTGLAFVPQTVKAKVGDTIEWVNEDFIDHTATANDESFDLPLAVGQSGTLALTKAGAFAYFCRVHPNMTGKLDVD